MECGPWSEIVRLLLFLSWFLLPPPVSTMPGAPWEEEDRHLQHINNNTSCVNGDLQEDFTCTCHPCWDGPTCATYVDYYAPRFVHAATAVLPVNATGVVYRAWSTDEDLGLTCPLGPGDSARCPCASVTYQLFAPPGDHHFLLDQVSGILSRNNDTLTLGLPTPTS
ncbi:uncharacterized protein LOC121874213 [Homarus americanus]|uniref:uncharacterized protein LOC121874213 n=1 Tax=Homarus americanus TaxID=6706 RepID=UPI001C46BE71|nr:uncharacterized protein LOC121874213 [Homarus americanus]